MVSPLETERDDAAAAAVRDAMAVAGANANAREVLNASKKEEAAADILIFAKVLRSRAFKKLENEWSSIGAKRQPGPKLWWRIAGSRWRLRFCLPLGEEAEA